MLNIYQVPTEEVTKIEWKDDFVDYDRQLSQLGNGHDEFLVVNPEFEGTGLYKTIENIPPTPGIKCIVWKFNGKWVAKYFHKSWIPDMGHWPAVIYNDIVWERNPDIPDSIPFFNDPSKIKLEELEGLSYQLIWYLDPSYNPTDDKVWVMKCSLKDCPVTGTKDMGYISPKVRIKYNPDIPKIDFDFSFLIPWYDLKYEHVWHLDERFNPTEDKIWAIKLKLMNGMPKSVKDMGYVSPTIIYNPELPVLDYTIDDHIPYYDLAYEHVWTVDERLVNSYEEVWAAKIVPHESEGVKVVGNIKCNLPEQLDVVFISYISKSS
jgi:hypothetical protein